MVITKLISDLRETERFKEWQAKNKGAKLVHLFLMLDPGKDVRYDIGFYDFEKKLMTSFIVDESVENIEITESKEIFTKDQGSIKPLEEDRAKISFHDACVKCKELQQEKYKQHIPIKEIAILQNLDIGQVWNITYITKTFETLNIKIDAENGNVVEDKLHKIFSFDK